MPTYKTYTCYQSPMGPHTVSVPEWQEPPDDICPETGIKRHKWVIATNARSGTWNCGECAKPIGVNDCVLCENGCGQKFHKTCFEKHNRGAHSGQA